MSKRWGADDVEAAWIDLNAANLNRRWSIGKPIRGNGGWLLLADDSQTSRGQLTAQGATEAACVGSMKHMVIEASRSRAA